ncbi:MAG: DUF6316 family protein [Proteobacteria bacterium]|jgi:hypothetical protein|nr:DUF6316 family protein [Pseudomonadota bacterium]
MSRHRNGELGTVPFRAGRFFYIDKQWYFACREGRNCGPFASKQEAEVALTRYIQQMTDAEASEYDSPNPHTPSHQPG